MPRATKINGNGHKKPKIEDFKMVSPVLTTEHEAISLPQEEITWEEALKLTGCLSRALLVLRLAPMFPDVDVDGLSAIPLAFKPQLEQIKEQIESEELTKQLGASISPQLEPSLEEIPLIEESQAIIKSDEAPKPAKKRGRPSKAELAQRNQQKQAEAIELAENLHTARTEHRQKHTADKQVVTDFELQQEALDALITQTEKAQTRFEIEKQFQNAEISERIEAINERSESLNNRISELKNYQVRTPEQTEKLKQESADLAQKHQDFFTQKPRHWEEVEDMGEW